MVKEAIRVVKPGGLIVFAETGTGSFVYGVSKEEGKLVAPGFARFSAIGDRLVDLVETMVQSSNADTHFRTAQQRGYDLNAATHTIMELLKTNEQVLEARQIHSFYPLSPWSTGVSYPVSALKSYS